MNAKRPVLRVLGWPDYTLGGVKAGFEEATGISLEYAHFDQNEEAFALLSRRPDHFDVVLGDGLWPRRYAEEGLIRTLLPTDFASWRDLFPRFRELCTSGSWASDDGGFLAYPANWGVRGVIWDPAHAEPIESWSDLWRAGLAGCVWTNSQGSEVIAETALSLGWPEDEAYELPADDLDAVRERLLELASRLGGIWMVLGELEDAFRSRGASVAEVHTTVLVTNLERALGRELQVAVPREGSVAWVDGAMVSSATKLHDEAVAFIDFLFSPRGFELQWAESDGYAPTSRAALAVLRRDVEWTEKVRSIELLEDQGVFDDCLLMRPPADINAYLRAWEDVLEVVAGEVPQRAWRGVRMKDRFASA